MTVTRARKAFRVVALLPLGLLSAGCRGRADFVLGEEAFREGQYRQAYIHYWDAYGQRPCEEYLLALRVAGSRVAEIDESLGRAAEKRDDLDAAIESYALAVDYDPLSPTAAERYARAWERRESASELEGEIAACRAKTPGRDPWRESLLIRGLAVLDFLPERHEERLLEAVRRAAESIAAPLRSATLDSPLPESPAEVEQLHGGWARFASEMESLVLVEEDDLFSGEPGRAETAALGIFKAVLDAYREDAAMAMAILDTARRGIGRFEEARAFEAAGDFPRAAEAYFLASIEHPFQEAARAGRARVVRRFSQDAYQASLLAVRERDWRAARGHLSLLLSLVPEHAEAQELFALVKRELADRYVLEARRFEDAGLTANALVRYYLALEQADGGRGIRDMVHRLEEAISSRLRPRLRVSFRAVDPDERQARRDLWGVEDEALSRMQRDVERSAQSFIDAITDSRRGAGRLPAAPEIELLVEDLDFTYPRGSFAYGVETARYVESFQLAPNPGLAAAEKAAVEARAALEESLWKETAALPLKRGFAAELVSLARARLRQAESRVAALSERVPILVWGFVNYPTMQVKLRVEAAARFRLEGESRWVSAFFESHDRVVRGDLGRNVAPDPEEHLSRAEALRILGPRLGEAVAREAQRQILSRQENLYREAVERLDAHSFDVATENLVVFLYSGRGDDDPLLKEAARRLEAITGLDLPAAWRREAQGPAAGARNAGPGAKKFKGFDN